MKRMRRLRRALQRGKMNDKAMTLIEVIVAMAILAVVVTPTLRMFASSSNTNIKSKYAQRATTVGESVMESFKAYTMQKLCNDFDYNLFQGVNSASSMNVEAFYGGDLSTPRSAFHTDHTLNEDAEKFHFTLDDVTVGDSMTSEKSTYDIDIWATPVRNPEVLSFEAPNAYSDAIIELKESIVKEEGGVLTVAGVIEILKDKAKDSVTSAHSEYTIEEVKLKDLKRIIDIDISDNGVSQTVEETITFTCKADVKYKKPSGVVGAPPIAGTETITDPTVMTYTVEFDDGAGGTVTTRKVYDNSATIAGQDVNGRKCKLNNVYFYYFPAYEEIYGDGAEDEININASLSASLYGRTGTDPKGEGTLPLNVIIARQTSTLLSDAKLMNQDAAYDYEVKGNLSGGGEMYLLHNYGEVIKDGLTYTPTMPSGRVSGFTEMKLIQDGVVEKTNLIYELEVQVYQAGTDRTNLMAEFVGTKNE